MFKLHWLAIIGLCALAPALLRAQVPNSVEAEFTGYHQNLSGTADRILAAPAQEQKSESDDHAQTLPIVKDTARFTTAFARVQQLRPILEPILREWGVPTGLAAVVLVESGGRATALSPKGARGLWQLMPDTARRYGLTVTPELDERLDPVKSTHAAARYLRDLHRRFGDWNSALAAYNAGEQLIGNLLRKTGAQQFQAISPHLPTETRGYVPAVLNAVQMFESPLPALDRDTSGKVLFADSENGSR